MQEKQPENPLIHLLNVKFIQEVDRDNREKTAYHLLGVDEMDLWSTGFLRLSGVESVLRKVILLH